MSETLASYSAAVRDFHRARRKAALRQLLDRVRGESAKLLPYEQVVRELAGRESGRWELHEIPLDAIVGSVGRYNDFSRDFLPLNDSTEGRWARVKVAMTGLVGLPPIEVYKVGEAYFVLDGNHRVSVARQLDASYIQAYVNEVKTKVPLTPEVDLDELIIKGELADFLARTHLDEARPGSDFTVTAPGRYRYLEHQIESRAGVDDDASATLPELAAAWHDQAYQPVLQLIREMGIPHEFPERTETDLYVWITQHRTELEQTLGWSVNTRSAAADLLARAKAKVRERLLRRARRELVDAAGDRDSDLRLVTEILVPISGDPDDWVALHQADIIAGREGAKVLGLHIVADGDQVSSPHAKSVQSIFESRCVGFQADCRLAIEVGKVARTICERASWADLVVVKLNHPPGGGPIEKLGSGFRTLLRDCPRPVLAVPRAESQLTHALLAYDGSPKAEEGLYLAAYMASRWRIKLTVASVTESGNVADLALGPAGRYLDRHAINYQMVAAEGEVADQILRIGQERGADFVICGGYGRAGLAEVVLGSTVDELLRSAQVPVLVCQ